MGSQWVANSDLAVHGDLERLGVGCAAAGRPHELPTPHQLQRLPRVPPLALRPRPLPANCWSPHQAEHGTSGFLSLPAPTSALSPSLFAYLFTTLIQSRAPSDPCIVARPIYINSLRHIKQVLLTAVLSPQVYPPTLPPSKVFSSVGYFNAKVHGQIVLCDGEKGGGGVPSRSISCILGGFAWGFGAAAAGGPLLSLGLGRLLHSWPFLALGLCQGLAACLTSTTCIITWP